MPTVVISKMKNVVCLMQTCPCMNRQILPKARSLDNYEIVCLLVANLFSQEWRRLLFQYGYSIQENRYHFHWLDHLDLLDLIVPIYYRRVDPYRVHGGPGPSDPAGARRSSRQPHLFSHVSPFTEISWFAESSYVCFTGGHKAMDRYEFLSLFVDP